jgi:choline dehydrogenase
VNWEILDAWRDAAEACGIPKIDEFNRGDNFGNAYFQMNQRRGRRWSATRAFLRPALDRPNLTVMTDTEISNVVFERVDGKLRATGVRIGATNGGRNGGRNDGRNWRQRNWGQTPFSKMGSDPNFIGARREVVLAAGSIGSPSILQRSGVGPGDELIAAGVPVRHELPGVGENLHDHLQVRTVYGVSNTKTLNRRANSLIGKAAMALEYFLFRTGPMTMPPSQLGAFARSELDRQTPNLEWHVQPLSLDKFGDPLHPFDAITPSVCNLKPTSRGHVRIRNPDASSAPAITLNYLSTDEDCTAAVEGLKFTRRIMAQAPLARFQPIERKPGPHIVTDDDLLDAARDLGTTIFHPVGTCKMGSDPNSVVDDRLAVHGIDRLRVIDASIMPEITAGNTNAPTVMIAEKGAEFIREAWGRVRRAR